MGEPDLGFVVEQHVRHFPEGFFARLGRRFLREYYRAFLTSAAARTTVAESEGRPVGYLVGVTTPAAHRQHVLDRHGPRLVAHAVASMLLRPWLAARFLRTRAGRYARKLLVARRSPQAPSSSGEGSVGVLTHVAVAPSAQSCGVGSKLVGRFERQAAEAGCDRLVLVTAAGDQGAGAFYRHRGWQALGEHRTPDRQLLSTYERAVDPGAGGPDDAVEE